VHLPAKADFFVVENKTLFSHNVSGGTEAKFYREIPYFLYFIEEKG
jgi:hypothetical protein